MARLTPLQFSTLKYINEKQPIEYEKILNFFKQDYKYTKIEDTLYDGIEVLLNLNLIFREKYKRVYYISKDGKTILDLNNPENIKFYIVDYNNSEPFEYRNKVFEDLKKSLNKRKILKWNESYYFGLFANMFGYHRSRFIGEEFPILRLKNITIMKNLEDVDIKYNSHTDSYNYNISELIVHTTTSSFRLKYLKKINSDFIMEVKSSSDNSFTSKIILVDQIQEAFIGSGLLMDPNNYSKFIEKMKIRNEKLKYLLSIPKKEIIEYLNQDTFLKGIKYQKVESVFYVLEDVLDYYVKRISNKTIKEEMFKKKYFPGIQRFIEIKLGNRIPEEYLKYFFKSNKRSKILL
jgi:hypothetical protein